MITAIRLREYNKKIGHMLRTYTMASGSMFSSGDNGMPSSVQIVTHAGDIAEAREIPQFEVLTYADEAELRAHLTGEMEGRARIGLPAVRAMVHAAMAPTAEAASVEKVRRVQQAVAPVDPFAGDEDDDDADDSAPEPEPVPAPAAPVAPRPRPGRTSADVLTPDPVPAPAPEPVPSGRRPSKSGSRRVPR